MAFVVVPHLSPDQKSRLSEILALHTSMPVSELGERTVPQANHVYVLPSNSFVRLSRGVLVLEPRPPSTRIPKPIDHFFRSMAADQKTRAVGVVLSGMDSDGANGLKAIQGEGGISIVQDPDSARFPEMPRSSIAADHVDLIVPPAQIGAELARLARHSLAPELQLVARGTMNEGDEDNMGRIFRLLRGVSGLDFGLYKAGTLRRRIARRMLLKKIEDLGEYAIHLQAHAEELRTLHEDLLINVTRFFRDPDVFDVLKKEILPRIFASRTNGEQVRVWVAGCSSGEEVYSIAICLMEHLGNQAIEPSIQIFGTDASALSISKARSGVYPESLAAEISPERLRKFFVKLEKGYQVAKRIRDLCIFARQNLCNDPPFSRLDLVSCRNVLIYLGKNLQKQILSTFHYALRPNSYLLLGNSETISDFPDLFTTIDRKHGFYARIPGAARTVPGFSHRRTQIADTGPLSSLALEREEEWTEGDLQGLVDRIILSRHGPPGVVIDEQMSILLTRGHTSPYFEMAPGTPSFYLQRMLRDPISGPVREAVQRSIEENIPIQTDRLYLHEGESIREVVVEVLPIQRASSVSRRFLVLFVNKDPVAGSHREVLQPESVETESTTIQLTRDLASTKLYLQSLIEDRDAKNQELITASEEIQSQNEELQSANEELETTKEEIQSANEELQTVNDELRERNTALNRIGNDLTNLLTSVNLPVLMLDSSLHIRHFTPATQRMMSVRSSDIGRPISEIRIHLSVDDLEPIVHEVLETLVPKELEVQDRAQRWHLLRVRPYRTNENKIDGAVLVLIDIDQSRRAQQTLRQARDFARAMMDNIQVPIVVLNPDFRIRSANRAFRGLAGSSDTELEGRSLPDLVAALWQMNELLPHLVALREQSSSASFEFEHQSPGEDKRIFCVRGLALQADGDPVVLLMIEDISARERAEELLTNERNQLRGAVGEREKDLVRTQEELRNLAAKLFTSQEEERRHVARELHDDITQKLALIDINLGQFEWGLSAEEVLGHLENVRRQTTALAEDVRRMSHRLHPAILDDLGLPIALKALTEEFGEKEEMPATFQRFNVPEMIPHGVAGSLYRIAQESLRNVAKHAGKTHVRVSLRGTDRGIEMEIADFGQGFDQDQIQQGLGLVSMIERARLVNGVVSIRSSLGRGTQVTVEIPL